jgi:hypothetical protein
MESRGNRQSGATNETMNASKFVKCVPDWDNCTLLVTSLMYAPTFKNAVFGDQGHIFEKERTIPPRILEDFLESIR